MLKLVLDKMLTVTQKVAKMKMMYKIFVLTRKGILESFVIHSFMLLQLCSSVFNRNCIVIGILK